LRRSKNRLPQSKINVLITGINGFAGSHLADLLVADGCSVSGISLNRDLSNLSRINSKISIHYGDVRDSVVVNKILNEVQPDYVYHLAGSAFVPEGDANPKLVYEINVLGTLTVLDSVRSSHRSAKILVVGSGEVYGPVPEEKLPVKEDFPLVPITPYGVTKACADLLAYQYATAYKMDVVRVRPFNHIGPRQSPQFVCSSFAKQIVEIEKGLRKPVLEVGNLDVRRDFTDVRDVVKAYRTVLENAPRGEVYNIGSGKAWRIGDLVDILIRNSTAKGIKLKQQRVRVRENDIPCMCCDASKLENDWGWKPSISMRNTLQDLLEYWRKTIQGVS